MFCILKQDSTGGGKPGGGGVGSINGSVSRSRKLAAFREGNRGKTNNKASLPGGLLDGSYRKGGYFPPL